MKTCYYRILGLSVRATAEEIKRSFRLLALRFHPDRNPGNPEAVERFRQALEAYETLVDPSRRKKYDRRRGYSKSRARNGRSRSEPQRDQGKSASFGEVFEDYFGVRLARGDTAGRSPDLRFDFQVRRSEIENGFVCPVEYVREVYCVECAGRGATKGKGTLCGRCGGVGRIEEPMAITITMPAECRNGACLRVAGAGDRTVLGFPAGDLAVYVQVLEGC